MYGKLFTQMYDGTLATRGPWQALVTFQQFIVLADQDGVVDMTAEAISRRTTIPLDIIRMGIVALEEPDAQSRTPDLDGKRIVRLSTDRDWGWAIVNYAHYRGIRSAEERREYMRKYQREYRAKKKDVNTNVNNVSEINQSSKQLQKYLKEDNPNSDPDGSGAAAPSKAEFDPRKAMFDLGVGLLRSQGEPESRARSFLAKLEKGYGTTAVNAALAYVAANPKVEAKSYLVASLKPLTGPETERRRMGNMP